MKGLLQIEEFFIYRKSVVFCLRQVQEVVDQVEQDGAAVLASCRLIAHLGELARNNLQRGEVDSVVLIQISEV